MIDKYIIRQKFCKRLRGIKVLPKWIKYFLIKKNDFLENEEIFLDHISSENINLWYFKNSDIGFLGLYLNGYFEKEEISLIKKIIKPGDVILDIGANIGYHSIIMSKIVGYNGRIYAFEPHSKNFEVLSKNIVLNRSVNVEAYGLAIGDANKKVSLRVFDDYAYNSLLDLKRKKYIKSERVNMKTIDSVVFSKQIKKIDLVKIDVEGYEFHVLKGARNAIQAYRPKIICEIYQGNLDPLGIKVADVINYVVSLDYKCYLIQGEEFVPVGSKRDNFQYYNFYFTSN